MMRNLAMTLCLLCLNACDEGQQPVETSDASDEGDGAIQSPFDASLEGDAADSSPTRNHMIYVAQAGVATPWITPVGPGGAGEPVRLGPERAMGYGQREGTISYPEVTPDGRYVVVVYYNLEREATLYALPTDGSGRDAPVAVARADALRALDRAYDHDWLAYVDGSTLLAAPLDGSRLDDPVVVRQAEGTEEITALTWISSERLAFDIRINNGSHVETAAADGSEANAPVVHSGHRHVAGALPGGSFVVYGHDDRLYTVGNDGDVVLTPDGFLPSYLGTTADGSRVIASLRQTWTEERQLLSTASDGSDADAPMYLTPQPMRNIFPLLSSEGASVAWVAQDEGNRWAAFVASTESASATDAHQITPWSTTRLHITDFRDVDSPDDRDVLLGTNDDGDVLWFDVNGSPDSPPTVLATVSDVVNHSGPWPKLSSDGSHVIYDANTPSGWQSWVIPLEGGTPQSSTGAWYRGSVTPFGVLHRADNIFSAVFAADLEGSTEGDTVQLSPWHAAVLESPFLTQDGTHVVYATQMPEPGWYAVPTAAADTVPADTVPATGTLVMPRDEPTVPRSYGNLGVPLEASGRLVRFVDGTLSSYALDGSEYDAPVQLLTGGSGPLLLHRASGRLVASVGSEVRSVPIDGSEGALLVGEAPARVSMLATIPGSDAILIVTQEGYGVRVLSASVTGADADTPIVVAEELPGWLMGLAPTPDGQHLLSVHSIEATAVPHPDLLLTSPLAPASALSGQTLAPNGYVLWGFPYFDSLSAVSYFPTLSADGRHAVLSGPDGLYSVRVDGTDADSPTFLGSARRVIGSPLDPGGTLVMSGDSDSIYVTEIDVADSQRRVAGPLATAPDQAFWTPDGHIVFRSPAPYDGDPQNLWVVTTDSGTMTDLDLTPLVPAQEAADRIAALTPDGQTVVFSRDSTLYGVAIDGGGLAFPLSAVDDAADTFVGFAE